jgi:2-amino-4-hydroxy-6-hydroxymethyldihydropteridine diphosphokinase
MTQVCIGIGSNIEPQQNIAAALTELRGRYGSLRLSPVYDSAPVGFTGERFWNLVAVFDTNDPATAVQDTLHAIESRHGRERGVRRFGPRTLDLDLLLYGDLVRHDGVLDLPRPEIRRYAFVLRPLADLAPAIRDPESGKTFRQLWDDLRPPPQLKALPVDFSGGP